MKTMRLCWLSGSRRKEDEEKSIQTSGVYYLNEIQLRLHCNYIYVAHATRGDYSARYDRFKGLKHAASSKIWSRKENDICLV